jgi:phage shock protein PspC (stress-responsive transcriptional regulator)
MTSHTQSAAAPDAPRARLSRNEKDGKFLGVCAGFADYLGVDANIVRVFFIALVLLAGTGGLLYFAAAAIMPRQGGRPSWAEEMLSSQRGAPIVGVALIVIAVAIVLGDSSIHFGLFGNAAAMWILLVAAGAWLVWWDRRRHGPVDMTPPVTTVSPSDTDARETTATATGVVDGDTADTLVAPAPRAPRRRPFILPGLAIVLVGVGIAGLLDAAGAFDMPLDVALGLAVALFGVAALVGQRLGRRVHLLVLLGVLLVPVTAAAAIADVRLSDHFGDRTRAPVTVAEMPHEYRLAAGQLKLDLTHLALPEGTTTVRVHIGAGEARIRVPVGVPVHVEGKLDAGEARVLGTTDDGVSVDPSHTDRAWPTATQRLTLHIDQGFGDVDVQRGS